MAPDWYFWFAIGFVCVWLNDIHDRLSEIENEDFEED